MFYLEIAFLSPSPTHITKWLFVQLTSTACPGQQFSVCIQEPQRGNAAAFIFRPTSIFWHWLPTPQIRRRFSPIWIAPTKAISPTFQPIWQTYLLGQLIIIVWK